MILLLSSSILTHSNYVTSVPIKEQNNRCFNCSEDLEKTTKAQSGNWEVWKLLFCQYNNLDHDNKYSSTNSKTNFPKMTTFFCAHRRFYKSILHPSKITLIIMLFETLAIDLMKMSIGNLPIVYTKNDDVKWQDEADTSGCHVRHSSTLYSSVATCCLIMRFCNTLEFQSNSLIYITYVISIVAYINKETTSGYQRRTGVNFINIVRAAFSYESALHSFSLVTYWL